MLLKHFKSSSFSLLYYTNLALFVLNKHKQKTLKAENTIEFICTNYVHNLCPYTQLCVSTAVPYICKSHSYNHNCVDINYIFTREQLTTQNTILTFHDPKKDAY